MGKNMNSDEEEDEFISEDEEEGEENQPSPMFHEPYSEKPGRNRKRNKNNGNNNASPRASGRGLPYELPGKESGATVDDLAKALSEQLKTPVEEFVESIEGIQNQIPVMVKKGIAQVLVAVQTDIQNVVENRVNTLIYNYTESLKKQQSKIGLKIYGLVIGLAFASLASLVLLAWYMTPSWEEIQQKKILLESLKKEIDSTPYEVKYLGQTYVRITPDSEIILHGHDGNHTYALPEAPSKKP